ncbi:PREDICTED: putative mediator of RNA polymerase II transcription subunit 26 isoform X2 [Bactrocera latifrons]|nr:PREDICTED: putative mediator of RNA polymerase II transcription subunit 26 isoform X2 [Bactrocera latifrons]XP_018791223.1 PREDICTED: putative mediator of RNA polymerase II transcription subunit 26 isoform X2 [Bactrocera latifrons]
MSQEDDSDIEMDIAKENEVPVTPRSNNHTEQILSLGEIKTNAHTPRRSTRKSVKPVQEYEEIVTCKRQLRSTSKLGEEIKDDKEGEATNTEEPQPRWTPAKVGRVSQKRSRKSRKTVGDKNKPKLMNPNEKENPTESDKAENLQNDKVIQSKDENINKADIQEENVANIEETEKEVITNKEEKDITNMECITNKEEKNINNTDITKSEVEDVTNKKECDEEHHDAVVINIKDNDNKNKNNNSNEENGEEIIVLNESIFQEKINESVIEVREEKNPDNFGTYLKSNNLDFSDLGLNPLTEENALNEDTQLIEQKDKSKIVESADADIQVLSYNDDYSNASDCIMLNTNVAEDEEEEMQPLQLSDDESSTSPPRKTPRIILTTDDGVEQKLNITIPQNDGCTPKRYSKTAKRMPTPYKKITDISRTEDDGNEKWEADEPPITVEISRMEPKEIVLRSIRKRSFSVCIGAAETDSKRKNVTFYSPANQTVILEDVDVRMIQSVKKNTDLKTAPTETFITQRRKRSMSFDEAMINKSKYRTQTPSKMGVTPQKVKPTRTKLPNFAAIHQKNFEKMENLVDHVNRKAERAKILTNSASKDRIASAQKPIKTHQATSMATNPDKSKAAKRINLHTSVNSTFSGISNTSMHKTFDTSHKELHDSKLPIPRIGVCKPLVAAETTHKENREVKLPNPRLGIIKPHTITVVSNRNKPVTPAKNALKPTQPRQAARPAFNLSTALETHANNVKSANATAVQITTAAVTKPNAMNANTKFAPTMSVDEKMATRRQRHMDMFKGRAANSRTTPGTAEKKFGQLIRGVRSNRRFELQMAHRQNMEH